MACKILYTPAPPPLFLSHKRLDCLGLTKTMLEACYPRWAQKVGELRYDQTVGIKSVFSPDQGGPRLPMRYLGFEPRNL